MSFLESRIKRAPTGLRKVLYLNWPLIVLVTAVAAVGILMLWSIAGGDFDFWARRQAQAKGDRLANSGRRHLLGKADQIEHQARPQSAEAGG